jgi:hypothetical protein
MTAKDKRERAWEGAVVRRIPIHSQQLTCGKKQYFWQDNQRVGNLDTKLNGTKSGDANCVAWTLKI